MREYEVHSVASKKNARDYTKALAQLADQQFPEQVPVSFLSPVQRGEYIYIYTFSAHEPTVRIAETDTCWYSIVLP